MDLNIFLGFFRQKKKPTPEEPEKKEQLVEKYKHTIRTSCPKETPGKKVITTLEGIQKQWADGSIKPAPIKGEHVAYILPGKQKIVGGHQKGAYPIVKKEGIILLEWYRAATKFAAQAGLEKADRKTLLQVGDGRLTDNLEAVRSFLEEAEKISNIDYGKEVQKYRAGADLAKLIAIAGELPDKNVLGELGRIKAALDGYPGFMDASCTKIYMGEYVIILEGSNNIFPSEKGLYALDALSELQALAGSTGLKTADAESLRALWAHKEKHAKEISIALNRIAETRKNARGRHEEAMRQWQNKGGLAALYGREKGEGFKLFEKN